MNAPIPPSLASVEAGTRTPRLTAAQRIERAVNRMSAIAQDVERRTKLPELEGAARGHAEAATRLMEEAGVVSEDGLRLVFLELAGVHAVTAQALQAKADEHRNHPQP